MRITLFDNPKYISRPIASGDATGYNYSEIGRLSENKNTQIHYSKICLGALYRQALQPAVLNTGYPRSWDGVKQVPINFQISLYSESVACSSGGIVRKTLILVPSPGLLSMHISPLCSFTRSSMPTSPR